MNQTDIDILKLSEAGRAALAHIDEVRALLIEEQQARHAAGTRVAQLEGLLKEAQQWVVEEPGVTMAGAAEALDDRITAALSRTEPVAGRWVSVDTVRNLIEAHAREAAAIAERDAAIARAEKAAPQADWDAACASQTQDQLCESERARDEVGIQYAAAQERLRAYADLERAAAAVDEPGCSTNVHGGPDSVVLAELRDALLRLRTTVPGDALAPAFVESMGVGRHQWNPTSPAGASAPASGSTPASSSATSSGSEVEGSRCGQSGTPEPLGDCDAPDCDDDNCVRWHRGPKTIGPTTLEPSVAQLCEVDAILKAGRTPVFVRTAADLDLVHACLRARDHEVRDLGTALLCMGVFIGRADASVTIVGGAA